MTIIDCDVHQSWPNNDEIIQRLPKEYRAEHFRVPIQDLPSPIGVSRDDAESDDGIAAGASYEKLKEQHMDAFGIDKAILTGSGILGLGVHPNVEYAKTVARAYNDALIDTWLTWDDRFFGAMIVAPQDPIAAAQEIRRVGAHGRIVQVLMCSATRIPFGQRFFWPMYEAAEEYGLPISVHPGTEGRGISNGFVSGPPSSYLEWHTILPQNYFGQVASLVCEGVFEKFPKMKFIAIEGGLAWIPGVMWRMDKNWKALRSTVPWLRRLPSEYIVDHIRFTTQPIEEPDSAQQLINLFEMIHAEKTVMFSSDYPHWDNDSPKHGLPRLPPELAERIYHKNAEELYKVKFDAIAKA